MRRPCSKFKACFFTSAMLFSLTYLLTLLKRYEESLLWQRDLLDANALYFVFGNERVTTANLSYKSSKDMFVRNTTINYKQQSSVHPIMLPKWSMRSLLEHSKNKRYRAFEAVITETEHDEMLQLLETFQSVCDRFNLSFMLYGGSLLGAYRHFGLIPWDDDIDVIMNVSDSKLVQSALERVSGYSLTYEPNRQWKFYRSDATANKSCCTNTHTDFGSSSCQCNPWPYIDIFFFNENRTHIWDNNKMYSGVYCYKKADVFPLIGFPFETLIMPVPRNIRKVLDKSYNVDLCVTLHFSHRREQRVDKVRTVPCKRLFPFFHFVFEKYHEDIVKRSLILGEELIYFTLSHFYERLDT